MSQPTLPTERQLFTASDDPRVYADGEPVIANGQAYITQATIGSLGTISDEKTALHNLRAQQLVDSQAFRVELATNADGHSYTSAVNPRVPEELIAQTPPEDLARFLAVTIRKAEELEATYQELLMQGFQYGDVDHRHMNIARNHLDIGVTFLLKALRDVDVLRS